MAYGVYSDRGYREHILERNKNTNKTEVFTQEDQTFTGRKTFLSGVTTSDLEVQTVEVSESLKVKGKDITEIIDYVPNDVSKENKLTTEDFVNSSIATNTAYFIGTFDSVEDLEAYEGEKTNNDYAFVRTADEFGAISFNRYKYNSQSESWEYEYTLNNSSFTSAQWDAINSGITAELVAKIGNSSFTSAQWDAINSGITAELVAKIGDGSVIDDTKTSKANAWSAEKISKMMSYTTEEMLTGGTYLGKPIYRKAGRVASMGTGYIVIDPILTSSYIDSVVAMNATGRVGNEIIQFGEYAFVTRRASLSVYTGGFRKLDGSPATTNFEWWIEYTKASD